MTKHLFIFTLLIAFAAIGCGKNLPADWPKTYPCKITVTKGGVPLDGAMVTLTPTGGGGNYAIGGITDAQGVAVIQTSYTNYSEAGSPEGSFKVTITKSLPEFVDPTPQSKLDAMDYEERVKHVQKMDEEANKRPPIVPKSISDSSATTLTIDVKSDGKTEATFDVDKK
ncbi:MAG: hypothetical protein LBU65_16065 [Planctomycetaceae bacterium]|jgi:hypothetical protein|nr:hypothetical protein [Planctomycetaceae bacterium]